ncbi:MAG: AAA family ATPase [Candidatus Sumerlaeota bacterium]|nr:AAA family ATPase [Candidatus Sumerlaeota bacterium]
MRLDRLEIKGFRSLRGVLWMPGMLNVVIGPNGSGKSNLLRLLEIISASAQGALGHLVRNWGGIVPLLWNRHEFGFSFDIVVSNNDGKAAQFQNMNYHVFVERTGNSSDYKIMEEEMFPAVSASDPSRKAEPFEHSLSMIKRYDGSPIEVAFEKNGIPTLCDDKSMFRDDETVLGQFKGPFANNKSLARIRSFFEDWGIFQDFHVESDSVIRQDVVASYDKRLASDGRNLVQVLHTLYSENREFKQRIDSALRAAFGDDYEELIFRPGSNQRVHLCARWKSLTDPMPASDLPDGFLRFLFIITGLSHPEPLSLIAIDEPENGLHPSMLPIIAELAADASERSQVIFTTHSPQLLDALTESRPTVTVCEWSNGESVMKTIEGKTLNYWLKKYTLGYLYETSSLEAI